VVWLTLVKTLIVYVHFGNRRKIEKFAVEKFTFYNINDNAMIFFGRYLHGGMDLN